MVRKLEAVYERGMLRPIEPLVLDEHQRVSLIILDSLGEDAEDLQFAPSAEFEARADHTITHEAVRAALAPIIGSLEVDFAAERDER